MSASQYHLPPMSAYAEKDDMIADLRAEIERLRAALELIDNFAWSALTADCEEARVELNRRVQVCREALK